MGWPFFIKSNIMFDSAKLYTAYKNLIGFKQHFDTSEIEIDGDLIISESGEYYQEKHPALRLDYIESTLPANQELDQYLTEKVAMAINGIFNDILQYRQVNTYGKTLLEQSTLLNRKSWNADKIVNQGRFVFLQIKVLDATGLAAIINEIGLQLDGEQTLTLYLFHSDHEDALTTFEIQTINSSTAWKKVDQQLNAFSIEDYNGGVFLLGYYQDDLTTQAVNYSNFNWDVGECSSCGGTQQYVDTWNAMKKNFFIYPGYMASGNFEVGKMPDRKKAFWQSHISWGLNLRMSVRCDLTDFFITNKFAFKNLLSLKVAHIILKDMKFSSETNKIQEHILNMVIRELEGDKETNALNIVQQYDRELKAVNFNIEGINGKCLGCKDTQFQPHIGVV